MTPPDIPKIVVLIVVGTAAGVTILAVLSVITVMLFKIPVEPIILQTIIQSGATAGGLLGGVLIKTKPE